MLRTTLLLGTLCLAFAIEVIAADSDSAPAKTLSESKEAPAPTSWEKRVTDVFFTDPKAVLVGPRPEYKTTVASAANTAGSAAEKSASGGAWSKLISADTLQDEIKSLQPQLADDVKTLQGFLGGGNKKARQDLSQLAAEFAIAGEYDGDVRWKNQSPAARDLFAKAGYNCKAATEATFREAKNRSDDLQGLVHGETITAPAGVEAKNDWSKIANLSPLMKRLELAQQDRISAAMASAGDFKKNAEQLTHETEMVAAYAEIIVRPGMENADDEKFRGFARTLQQSALDLRQAVRNENYDAAKTAAGVMAKTCTACHAEYR